MLVVGYLYVFVKSIKLKGELLLEGKLDPFWNNRLKNLLSVLQAFVKVSSLYLV